MCELFQKLKTHAHCANLFSPRAMCELVISEFFYRIRKSRLHKDSFFQLTLFNDLKNTLKTTQFGKALVKTLPVSKCLQIETTPL